MTRTHHYYSCLVFSSKMINLHYLFKIQNLFMLQRQSDFNPLSTKSDERYDEERTVIYSWPPSTTSIEEIFNYYLIIRFTFHNFKKILNTCFFYTTCWVVNYSKSFICACAINPAHIIYTGSRLSRDDEKLTLSWRVVCCCVVEYLNLLPRKL